MKMYGILHFETAWVLGRRETSLLATGSLKTPAVVHWQFVVPNQISVSQSECGQSFKVSILNQYARVLLKEMLPTAIVSALSLCLLPALAVGRGGEVAFLRYDLCWWDDIFQCLEAIWS
jgi:hypothetical protein